MESACEIQINNRINFTSGTACYHSGAPHRSKWNGCTAYAEQLSRFTVTCSFMIPIVYLVLIIPLEYALELYSKYELLFLRMTFKEEKDKETKIRHRIAVLCTCRISVRRVLLFQREYMGRMYVRMKDKEFKNLIQEFRKACKRPTSQI